MFQWLLGLLGQGAGAGAGAGTTASGVQTGAAGVGAGLGGGGVSSASTAVSGSIPAWVPYALRIYGAASGDKNAQALGGVLGDIRGDQVQTQTQELLGERDETGGFESAVDALGRGDKEFDEENFFATGGKITRDGKGVKVDAPNAALKSMQPRQKSPVQKATPPPAGPPLPNLHDFAESERAFINKYLGE